MNDFDITVDRHPAQDWNPEQADVTVRMSDGDTVRIRVSGPDERWTGGMEPASVSWPSIGAVNADDAAAFAAAVTMAAALAAELAPPLKRHSA